MCHAATCATCKKKTWFGCGMHVPGVMDSVPEEERCECEPKVEKDGKKYPPMAGAKSRLAGLFGGKKNTPAKAGDNVVVRGDGKDITDHGEMVEGQKMGKTTPGGMFRSLVDHVSALASTNYTK